MSEFLSIYITVPSLPEAERIARTLVEEWLAACVNILPQGQSVYRWQDKLETAEECILFVKATKSSYSAVERRVKDLHSAEVPCILALPIVAGYPPFLEWVESETGDNPKVAT